MIDVTVYIRELLFSHDCVILPGFGGFIGNYTPARIDQSTNTFSPPFKSISFNRNLNNNDGLLISKISADRSVGYADSKRLVEEFVEDLRRKLNKGERVTLDLIGFFQNNNEGNAQFEPDSQSNYLLDSYGLTSFNREPISEYDVTERVLKRYNHESRPLISRKMIWRAAIAVPFVLAMVFVPLKTDLFKSNASLNPLAAKEVEAVDSHKLNEATTANTEALSESPVTDEESAAASTDLVTNEKQSSNIEEAPVVETTKPVVSSKTYTLITGSFKAESNALRQKAELTTKGYKAEISSGPDGYFRVTASTYSTYSEANAVKKEMTAEFPGTWILMN